MTQHLLCDITFIIHESGFISGKTLSIIDESYFIIGELIDVYG